METTYNRNPQEPPSAASSHESMGNKRRLPLCIYDIFFDIPHPSVIASAVDATRNVVGLNNDRQDVRARIIDAPVVVCPLVVEELYNPDNITRISRFAFPEFDENQSSEYALCEVEKGISLKSIIDLNFSFDFIFFQSIFQLA